MDPLARRGGKQGNPWHREVHAARQPPDRFFGFGREQAQSGVEGEHPREAGRGEFSCAPARHECRGDAESLPHFGKSDLDGERCCQRGFAVPDPVRGFERGAEVSLTFMQLASDGSRCRQVRPEIEADPGSFRSPALEHRPGRCARDPVRKGAPGFLQRVGQHAQPLRKVGSARAGGLADSVERVPAVVVQRLQMRLIAERQIAQRLRRLPREREKVRCPGELVRRLLLKDQLRWSLLQHGVRVRPAEAERAHAPDPSSVDAGPGSSLRGDGDRQTLPGNVGIGGGEVQVGRNLLVLEGEHYLEKTRDACRGLQVADVGLDRSDEERRTDPAIPEHTGQGRDLDGIAEGRSRPMRLQIADLVGIDRSILESLSQNGLLGGPIGHGETARLPILVDRRAPNEGCDAVAVGDGVGKTLQQDHSASFAPHVAVGARVERLAAAIGRQEMRLGKTDAAVRKNDAMGAAGQRRIALSVPEALAGEVNRHQRRRTSGIHGDARTLKAEDVGQPTRGDAERVSGPQIGVDFVVARLQVHEVVDAADPDEDTGRSAHETAVGNTGVLDGLPGDLEQRPLLRIHRRRFTRRDSKKIRVELL